MCNSVFADLASDALEELGAKGTLMHETQECSQVGVIEESWRERHVEQVLPAREVRVEAFYSMPPHTPAAILEAATLLLSARGQKAEEEGISAGRCALDVEFCDDSVWLTAWRAGFGPHRVGQKIIIAPPWDMPSNAQPGEVVVIIDPGMAFGTGTHPTTKMCLEICEQVVTPGCIVADIGTGSGILAISAALLGAHKVYAWDNDEVALDSARANIDANRVSAEVRVFSHESADDTTVPPEVADRCDVVFANIGYWTLLRLRAQIAQMLLPEGVAVLSGIIADRAKECVSAYAEMGFSLAKLVHQDDWAALWLRKEGGR